MARLSDSERLIWAWRARAEAAERERDRRAGISMDEHRKLVEQVDDFKNALLWLAKNDANGWVKQKVESVLGVKNVG